MLDQIFKAYDIRGVYPQEINERVVADIVKAYVQIFQPKKVAVGRDVRLSGESLKETAIDALIGSGVDVVDVGVVSSDMLYFAVASKELDGGISITASHNAGEYNGIKLVGKGAEPISLNSGLDKIRDLIKEGRIEETSGEGAITKTELIDEYLSKVLSFINKKDVKTTRVVVNPNFGASGKVVEQLAKILNLDLVKMNFEEDGSFPKGKPDPLLPENQKETAELVVSSESSLGVSWDADADRCFFFDEKGQFVPPYYVTAILAKMMLQDNKGAAVVMDPRLVWATQDAVKEGGGLPVITRAGRSFVGQKMRESKAVFSGEISGHYFFRDFFYCDNGMIPFLLILERLSRDKVSLSEIVEPYREKYPNSGEINYTVSDVSDIMQKIKDRFNDGELDTLEGITVTYPNWRFNIRSSNTEPLVRLNVEAKDKNLMEEKVSEITSLIEG